MNAAIAFRPVQRPANRRVGFVYFATDGEYIKIGHSVGPAYRVTHLQSPVGKPVRLLTFFPGHMDEEHNLHRRFADLLEHGDEWFRPSHELTAFIALLERHREPLFVRLIEIDDVTFDRHVALLEIPPADRLEKWLEREAHNWPGDLQAKVGRYVMSIRYPASASGSEQEDFEAAYRKWSGI